MYEGRKTFFRNWSFWIFMVPLEQIPLIFEGIIVKIGQIKTSRSIKLRKMTNLRVLY